MSLEAQIAALVQASNNLTGAVNGKMAQIDKKVDDAVNAVPQAIIDNFSQKSVRLDPVTGNDSSPNGPFRTLSAAVASVPDGGSLNISLPNGSGQKVIELAEAIYIGSRRVTISGGSWNMEALGLKLPIIKPLARKDEATNRTVFRGYFYGDPGGRIYFRNVRFELPRKYAGTDVEHSGAGSLIYGGLSLTMFNWDSTGHHIYYENGTEDPMPFLRSGARDGKANMADFTMSHTSVQTVNGKPIFDMQYSNGTIRFGYYSCQVSDKGGLSVTMKSLFNGLSYGTHGYATNVLSSQDVVKQ